MTIFKHSIQLKTFQLHMMRQTFTTYISTEGTKYMTPLIQPPSQYSMPKTLISINELRESISKNCIVEATQQLENLLKDTSERKRILFSIINSSNFHKRVFFSKHIIENYIIPDYNLVYSLWPCILQTLRQEKDQDIMENLSVIMEKRWDSTSTEIQELNYVKFLEFLKLGLLPEAKSYLVTWEKNLGSKLNTQYFNGKLLLASQGNNKETFKRIWSEMQEAMIPASSTTLSILLRVCRNMGEFTLAKHAFVHLPNTYRFIRTDKNFANFLSLCRVNNEHLVCLQTVMLMERKEPYNLTASALELGMFSASQLMAFDCGSKLFKIAFTPHFPKPQILSNPDLNETLVEFPHLPVILGFNIDPKAFWSLGAFADSRDFKQYFEPIIEDVLSKYGDAARFVDFRSIKDALEWQKLKRFKKN